MAAHINQFCEELRPLIHAVTGGHGSAEPGDKLEAFGLDPFDCVDLAIKIEDRWPHVEVELIEPDMTLGDLAETLYPLVYPKETSA